MNRVAVARARRVVVLLMLVCAGLRAATGTTLSEAVSSGLAMDPQVRSASADTERARVEVDIARNGLLPVVEASTGRRAGATVYGVTVTQTVFDWGRKNRRIDTASALARSEAEGLSRTREEVAFSIADTYIDVLTSMARVATTRRQIESLRAISDLSELRMARGYADSSETGRIASELTHAHEQLATEEGRLTDAKAQYRELTGLPAQTLVEPAVPDLFSQPSSLARLDLALRDTPAVRQMRAEVEAQTARVQEAKVSMWPQVELLGNVSRTKALDTLYYDRSIVVQLRLDPIQGLSARDRARAEQHRLESAEAKLHRAERELKRKVLSSLESISALKAREPLAKERVKQLLGLEDVYAQQFQAGRRSFNDLLTLNLERSEAERQVLNVQDQLSRTPLEMAARLGLLLPWLEGRLIARGDDHD